MCNKLAAFRTLLPAVLALVLVFALTAARTAQSRSAADAAPARPQPAGTPPAFRSVAAGDWHSCAVSAHGDVQCWGWNQYGQLGDGTKTNRPRPVNVSGLAAGVLAVAGGSVHTCAVHAGGGVQCWGRNDLGQLGDASPGPRTIPGAVQGLAPDIRTIVAGAAHTCALAGGGSVHCWGWNEHGQSGTGAASLRTLPAEVAGLSGGTALAAGAAHTCALAAGEVKCWGGNAQGQLGDGSSMTRTLPVAVTALAPGVTAIAAGERHTCALAAGGEVWCWGANDEGQLGDGTTTRRLAPVAVSGLPREVAAIAAQGAFTCALAAGEVKCWGSNRYGQLGDGTLAGRGTPQNVARLAGVEAIAAGAGHACALADGGEVWCWGNNWYGQLGDGTHGHRPAPVDVPGLGGGVKAAAAGSSHVCALTTGGGVKCWGSNGNGQLGDGGAGGRWAPGDVAGLTQDVQALAGGLSHACALTTGGGVKCWGNNQFGQLGTGTLQAQPTPADVAGLGEGMAAVAAGYWHTCALTAGEPGAGGGVKCWGRNQHGQLGNGTTADSPVPVDVSGLARGVLAIAAGFYHTCALTTSGAALCWGRNAEGQLGDLTTLDRWTPVGVAGLGSDIKAITSGSAHNCALTTAGGVKCWPERYGPDGLPGSATALAAGAGHTCVVTSDGGVWCWGANGDGQLGDGTTGSTSTPVAVQGLAGGAAAVTARQTHTCAVTTGGGVKCWGYNASGQLGVDPGWTPVAVLTGSTGAPAAKLYLPLAARP